MGLLPAQPSWFQQNAPPQGIQPVQGPNGTPTAPVASLGLGGSLGTPGTALTTPAGAQTVNATTATPAAGGGTPTPNTGDVNAAIRAYIAANPQPDITKLAAALKAQGFNVSIPTHAGGTLPSTDKLVLPDSSVVDLISSGGAWQSPINDGYWVNGQPSTTPASVGLTPPPPGAGGNTLAGMAGGGVGGFAAPGPFVPPTGVTMQNDPAYQFDLQQGEKAINDSAAARGTLLTSGNEKNLINYAGGQALNAYQNVFNNANTAYTTNANVPLAYDTLNSNNLLGLSGQGLSATEAATNAGTSLSNTNANLLTGQGDATGHADLASGANWSQLLSQLNPSQAAQLRQALGL